MESSDTEISSGSDLTDSDDWTGSYDLDSDTESDCSSDEDYDSDGCEGIGRVTRELNRLPLTNHEKIDEVLQECKKRQLSLERILEANLPPAIKTNCLEWFCFMKEIGFGPTWIEYRNKIISTIEGKCVNDLVLENQIRELEVDDKTRSGLERLLINYQYATDSNAVIARNVLMRALSFPFGKVQKINLDRIPEMFTYLDSKLYGMERVKRRLISSILSKKRPIIGLCGNPGVGKTSVAYAFAEAIGLPFQKISVNSIQNNDKIRGSAPVFVGASTGLIYDAICNAKSIPCVVLIDEIDKMDISVAKSLIDILDSTQNSEYTDNFISGIVFDISQVIFVCTLNRIADVHPLIANRMSIERVPDYTLSERIKILTDYIIPSHLRNYDAKITIPINVVKLLAREPDIRKLEQAIEFILSELALDIHCKKIENNVAVDQRLFQTYVTNSVRRNDIQLAMYV